MNNLKRVFSLALAGAMLAGMMVMGASAADFTDAGKIVNTEAVDVAVALSIINGKDDGSYFDPEGLVTRGEMAKMIAVAVNGGKEPNMGVKTTATYTDIKGHWAEQYIEYCSDMKYINGRGDGTFDPAGNVTGIEAAKMVLTALGYDAKAYQLTGADWAINTNYIAMRTCSPSLYDNMAGVPMNNPLSRDNAAQMIWNGMKNTVVEYDPNVSITGGDLSYGYAKNPDGKTLLNQAYGALILEGTYAGNADFGSISGIKEGQISVKGCNIPSDLSIDYIGEEVRVVYKDGKGGQPGKPDEKDTIFGVFVTGNTNVVRGTLADFGDNKVKGEAKIKFDGTKYDVADSVKIYNNFTTPAVTKATYHASEDANSALTSYLKKTSGATVKMTFNDDNEVQNIYVTESKIARVTAINSTKVTLNNGIGAIEFDGNDIYDGIKKGDVVEVTTLYAAKATDTGAYNIVKKAESVTGTVEIYKNDKDTGKSTSVTLDGKTYKVAMADYKAGSSTVMFGEVASSDTVTEFSGTCLNEEFELYLIGGMVVGAVQLSESNSNYSLVISKNATGTSSVGVAIDGAKAEVLLSDGTKTVLTLNSDSRDYTVEPSAKITNATYYNVGDIVTYSVDKNGYAALEVRAKTTTGNVAYKAGTKVVEIDSNSYNVAADCVVYMDIEPTSGDGNYSFKAYDLRNLKSIEKQTGVKYTAVIVDDEVVALYLEDQGGRPAGATSSTVYGIVSAYNGQVKKDGTAYRYVTVQSAGEKYDAYLSSTVKNGTSEVAVGDIVKMEVANDSIYSDTDFTVINNYKWIVEDNDKNHAVAGYVKSYNEKDNTVTVSKTYVTSGDAYKVSDDVLGTYAITKDTLIYFVDCDNDVAVESAGIGVMDAINHKMNIIVIGDSDGKNGDEAAVIIFETSNDADILDVKTFSGSGYGFKA